MPVFWLPSCHWSLDVSGSQSGALQRVASSQSTASCRCARSCRCRTGRGRPSSCATERRTRTGATSASTRAARGERRDGGEGRERVRGAGEERWRGGGGRVGREWEGRTGGRWVGGEARGKVAEGAGAPQGKSRQADEHRLGNVPRWVTCCAADADADAPWWFVLQQAARP